MLLIQGIGMISIGILFPLYMKYYKKANWKPIFIGALFWIICVALKFSFAIPFNKPVLHWLVTSMDYRIGEIIFYIYVGLLTGIFECLVSYLLIKYSSLRKYNYDNALAFGIGFGSIEAFFVGLVPLLSVIISSHVQNNIQLTTLTVPIVERFFTVFIHVFCSVLIFYAIKTQRISYFMLSFLIKTLVDGLAGWFDISISHNTLNIWLAEFIVAIFGIISIVGLKWIKYKYLTTEINQPVVKFA